MDILQNYHFSRTCNYIYRECLANYNVNGKGHSANNPQSPITWPNNIITQNTT